MLGITLEKKQSADSFGNKLGNSVRLQGGGFGLKGAAKGIAKAETFNFGMSALGKFVSHQLQMSDEEKADFDKTFTAAKNNFFMVAENYPALRSSENFMQLQKTLNETEEQLSASRRTYNAAVTDYNNSVMTFPSNIIANLFSFTKKEVFAIPEEEKVNPDVKKLFRS